MMNDEELADTKRRLVVQKRRICATIAGNQLELINEMTICKAAVR